MSEMPMPCDPTPEVADLRTAGFWIAMWANRNADDQFGPLLSAWLYRAAEAAQDTGNPPYDLPEALALARLINSNRRAPTTSPETPAA